MSDVFSRAEQLLQHVVQSRRPVYLDLKRDTTIGLDGYGLSIRVAGEAERILQMRYVSRIVANERCQFSTAALLACADRGISILFVDPGAEVRGRLLGTPGGRQEIPQRLVDLVDRPDWRARYDNWLFAQQRHALLRVQHRLGLGGSALNAARLAHAIARVARDYAGNEADAQRSEGYLDEQLFAWMLSHLQTLGLAAGSELGQDGFPDLVTDMADILTWYGVAPRIGWLRRRAVWAQRNGKPLSPVTRRDMIYLYQRHANRLQGFGHELTNRLHRWLVESA